MIFVGLVLDLNSILIDENLREDGSRVWSWGVERDWRHGPQSWLGIQYHIRKEYRANSKLALQQAEGSQNARNETQPWVLYWFKY